MRTSKAKARHCWESRERERDPLPPSHNPGNGGTPRAQDLGIGGRGGPVSSGTQSLDGGVSRVWGEVREGS